MQIIIQGPDMALIPIPEGHIKVPKPTINGLKRYPKPALTEP